MEDVIVAPANLEAIAAAAAGSNNINRFIRHRLDKTWLQKVLVLAVAVLFFLLSLAVIDFAGVATGQRAIKKEMG